MPEDEVLWDIQEKGFELLKSAGYEQYEVSAFAKADSVRCRHNLNYWQNGDYLGIGCGAHGKITFADKEQILRTVKVKHPRGYMDDKREYLDNSFSVSEQERPFEYMMNRLRLFTPFSKSDFEQSTGLEFAQISEAIDTAVNKGLLAEQEQTWQVSPLGQRYLNDLLSLFL